jgi:O-antigen/teichoic acid export membrane protein
VGDDTGEEPKEGRHETPVERLDRQFDDILQELRVSQAGVQILFAFLLGIAFTPVFADIADWQRDVYIATLITTVLAAIMFIGPVSYHRIVFRQQMRGSLVAASNIMAIIGIFFLMLSMVGAVLLVVSVVLGPTWAAWTTTGVAVVFLVLWYGLPLLRRSQGNQHDRR